MNDNSLSDVELVLALNGTPPEPETDPAPEVTEPDVDELEQLRLDVIASGDPALVERFERAMEGLHAAAKTLAEKDAEIRTLIAGHELWFVQRFPEAALRYYNSLLPDDKAALTETLRVQYELATSSPIWASGDGKMQANPMAVTPPTLGGSDADN